MCTDNDIIHTLILMFILQNLTQLSLVLSIAILYFLTIVFAMQILYFNFKSIKFLRKSLVQSYKVQSGIFIQITLIKMSQFKLISYRKRWEVRKKRDPKPQRSEAKLRGARGCEADKQKPIEKLKAHQKTEVIKNWAKKIMIVKKKKIKRPEIFFFFAPRPEN